MEVVNYDVRLPYGGCLLRESTVLQYTVTGREGRVPQRRSPSSEVDLSLDLLVTHKACRLQVDADRQETCRPEDYRCAVDIGLNKHSLRPVCARPYPCNM